MKPEDVMVVTGTIGADGHVVGTLLVSNALERAGFRVTRLGCIVTDDEFVSAAQETAASAILVSSLYGHAAQDSEELRAKCTEVGLDKILLYIGGMLVVDKTQWPVVVEMMKKLGFNRADPPRTRPETFIADLKADLGIDE